MTFVSPSEPSPVQWVCWLALVVAVVTDVRSMKIPNVLTVPLMIAGLGLHALDGTPMVAILGLAAAFVVHFGLFALGVDKAGDAKLMMGVGACLGWAEMIEATLFALVAFLPAALLLVFAQGRLANLLAAGQWTLARVTGQEAGERPAATYLVKAPFILLGVMLATVLELL